jgi:hypothetical protein
MIASYGETSGFSTVGVEELMLVNGGKGSSSNSSSSSNKPPTVTGVGGSALTQPKPDGISPVISLNDPGVSIKDGNTTVTVTAHIDYNGCPPTVASVTATVSHGISK